MKDSSNGAKRADSEQELNKRSLPADYEITRTLYQRIKDGVFDFYLWGIVGEEDDVIDFYKEILGICRKYDNKFYR